MMTTAIFISLAINLHKGSNRGSWKPLQQGSEKRDKRKPRPVYHLPPSFREFNRAHPQGCSVCYGRGSPF